MAGPNGSGKDGTGPVIGPQYPLFQLAKALHHGRTGGGTAEHRIRKWQAVLHGMLAGDIDVGTRTPLADIPAWVTLEVATGGFATGALLAGGALRPHERGLATELNLPIGGQTRALLNAYFLGEDGQARLAAMTDTGHFRIEVPEEGALLVVYWLARHGETGAAQDLLDHLVPFFDRLRFFPIPASDAPRSGALVCLQTVGQTIEALDRMAPQQQASAQADAILVWTPLYDRAVDLLLATVNGAPPRLDRDAAGRLRRDERGLSLVGGGRICRITPPGWPDRARALMAAYGAATLRQAASRRWQDTAGAFRRFLQAIDAHADGRTVPAGEQAHLERALAHFIAKWGVPTTDEHRARRMAQARQCTGPLHRDIARLLTQRLAGLPKADGLADPALASRPIDAAESRPTVPDGTAIPRHLSRKVGRAQVATIEDLIGQGYIASTDLLAVILPQITADIRAAGFRDPALRHLFTSLYRAFRRRRSLLLLNLESQVGLGELPWIAAMEPHRGDTLADQDLAKTALQDVTLLALRHFPYAIIPNKLVQELQALAHQAGLGLPLVREIAADIFMGAFSAPYLAAADRAGALLAGTLYERYYGIDFAAVRALASERARRRQAEREGVSARHRPADPSLIAFATLCSRRAHLGERPGWSIAGNGAVIEQQQILTTQNLATLYGGLALESTLGPVLPGLAERCFRWICLRQQRRVHGRHAGLIMLKKTGYAWRQMIFFLALLPDADQPAFLDWMRQHLAAQSAAFRARFAPAVTGLASAMAGRGATDDGGRPFLGWAVGDHWLMPADDRPWSARR